MRIVKFIGKLVKKVKELVQEREILEEKRSERAVEEERRVLQEIRDGIIRQREQCPQCGFSAWECHCYLDEDGEKPEIPQMGLPAGEDEEEIPLWLEHANTPCLSCGLLPEFCQCQYEE